MERRDYIERQIEQIAHFVARILGLSAEDPAAAVREADGALARSTGFSLAMLLRLGAGGMLGTVGRERTEASLPLLEAAVQALRMSLREADAERLEAIVLELRRMPAKRP